MSGDFADKGCAVRIQTYFPQDKKMSSIAKVPLTVAGAAALKAELHRLKTIERPAVIVAISEARAQGDLSENAEYDAAKEKQGFIEGRINELEGKLASAQIITPAMLEDDGRVVFGVTVDLEATESGEKVSYQIVGEDEADIKFSKISFSSPIARAMIGKNAGDVVEVRAPGGIVEYEIVDVRYV
jgi:transcription elongation factor GreA